MKRRARLPAPRPGGGASRSARAARSCRTARSAFSTRCSSARCLPRLCAAAARAARIPAASSARRRGRRGCAGRPRQPQPLLAGGRGASASVAPAVAASSAISAASRRSSASSRSSRARSRALRASASADRAGAAPPGSRRAPRPRRLAHPVGEADRGGDGAVVLGRDLAADLDRGDAAPARSAGRRASARRRSPRPRGSRSATAPSPLATQTGAEPLARDHFSATAKWVGFTMTTSAFGTSSSMRLVAIAWARLRRCAFMCGSPSDCLASSRISWKDMRSRRAWSKRCQTRSTAAMATAIRQAMRQQHRQRLHHHPAEHLRLGGGGADHPVEVAREIEKQRDGDRGELDRRLGELDQPGGAELLLGVGERATAARASAAACRPRRRSPAGRRG